METDKPLDRLSMDEVMDWLMNLGFSVEVQHAFQDQDMDGEAIAAAFAVTPGPDCIRDVVKKVGIRMKVYQAIKKALEKQQHEPIKDNRTREDSDDIVSESSGVTRSIKSLPPTHGTSEGSLKSCPSTSGAVLQCSQSASAGAEPFKVPDPFPIPTFRKHTQARLLAKQLTPDDRKYMVTVLGTMLLTYVEKASKRQCLGVAQSLVRKYPFLKEPYSWQEFIYTKCQNINRKPQSRNASSEEPPAKRSRFENVTMHNYPSVSYETEDEESNKRNHNLLETELKGCNPDTEKIKELIRRTFKQRRKWILEGAHTIQSICAKYPVLKMSSYLSMEFDLIMQQSDSSGTFISTWNDWTAAIIDHALATKYTPAGLKEAMRDIPKEQPVNDIHELESLTALRILGHYFTIRKKDKGPKIFDIPYVLYESPRGTPPEEAIDAQNNQPHIVKFKDADPELRPQYFIAIEQNLVVECNSLVGAVYTLLMTHYVFDLGYHPKAKDFYMFLEHLLDIKNSGEKKSANFLSTMTGIESFKAK